MSSNSNQIRDIIPGGPDPQPNSTGELNEITTAPTGVPTFVHDRVIDKDPFAPRTTAEDTMTGATSADVYSGYGHPGQGQTSTEVHHDGQHGRKKQGSGADQWGGKDASDLKVNGEKTRDIQL